MPYLRWLLKATTCVLVKERQRKCGDRQRRMRMAEGRVWIDADKMQEHQQLAPAAGVGEDASSPEPPREIWPGRLTT